jgi:1,4-alpha-glucan branching enzyme
LFGGHAPLVVSPYDAELYGHWWYEGPQFLDFFFRKLHFHQSEIEAVTPGDFLDAGIPIQVQRPSASSWGEKGYFKVWINEANSWMYPYQHDAERRMTALADRFASPSSEIRVSDSENTHLETSNSELETRILDQLARELLLAQSSDWAFQIYQGTTVEYSSRRFKSHIHRFDVLAKMLESGHVNESLLAEIESRDNIFQEIDHHIYRSKSPEK